MQPSPRDIVAGLAVAGLIIPEGVAYAGIAGFDPARALATGIAGGLAYALIGRSRFAVIAPTSSSAAILAAALGSLPAEAGMRDALATMLVAIGGLVFLTAAAFRLGSLSAFVSRPVLHGFALGLALTIVVRQLPKLLGVTGVSSATIAATLGGLAARAGSANAASVVTGMAALALLFLLKRWPRLPGTLIVLLLGIAASALLDLPAHGVAVAGQILLKMPRLTLPALSPADWARLGQLAVPITLILFAESWGTVRGLALRHGDAISSDRELVALGAANLCSALAHGMPAGAGFSAGSACEAAGAQSRAAALTAALAVLLLALFAGGLIARIPEPVLAAIVIAALAHALSPQPIVQLFRIDRDQWIALAATGGVLLLGVLNGMLAAVVLSVAALLRTYARPRVSTLGCIGDDAHDYVDIDRHAEAQRDPGIGIYRPNAPLFFANAEAALGEVARRAAADGARVVVLSLEQSSDLDSTSLEAIGEFAAVQARSGRPVVFARLHDAARSVMAVSGLAEDAGEGTFSVADAVDRARAVLPLAPAKSS
ncbi:MAG: SulP family inorganic anion transporter [Sphingomonadales bacterium]|nr:SulP family inorganic anion transporter [Sphingomonadales bacterium]